MMLTGRTILVTASPAAGLPRRSTAWATRSSSLNAASLCSMRLGK